MKTTFSLISKTIGKKYSEYNGNAIRLNKFLPYSVDEVIIGKNNSKQIKKIITFRDSNGKITERVFDYPDKPLRNRLYSQVDNTIGNDEYVESKTVKDYYLDREAIDYYKDFMQFNNKNQFMFWNNKQTTTNHVSYNVDKNEIILTQVKVINKNRSRKQTHSFTEFPKIVYGKKEKTEPKYLSFDIKRVDNSVIQKSLKGNVNLPTNDSYLGYRALTIEDSKIPFTQKYLKERKMDNKDISINPQYNPINEDPNFSAIFNAENGNINFNKDVTFISKSKLTNTSRHEVEHAWHYYLQALLNKGGTPWQTDMYLKFGEISDKNLIKEAQSYDESIKNYVPYYVDIKKYKKNYIEIKAREKGEKESEKYDFDGLEIRNTFKHIPSKLL